MTSDKSRNIILALILATIKHIFTNHDFGVLEGNRINKIKNCLSKLHYHFSKSLNLIKTVRAKEGLIDCIVMMTFQISPGQIMR
jgi:hypothetical protein